MRARGHAPRLLVRESCVAVLDRRLRPGQRIGQPAIASEFGVSRLPVREASRELQSESLVTLLPNAGARVASRGAEELEEVSWLRERLEPPLLAESLPRLSADVVAQLRQSVDQMETLAEGGDTDAWEKADRDWSRGAGSSWGEVRCRRSECSDGTASDCAMRELTIIAS